MHLQQHTDDLLFLALLMHSIFCFNEFLIVLYLLYQPLNQFFMGWHFGLIRLGVAGGALFHLFIVFLQLYDHLMDFAVHAFQLLYSFRNDLFFIFFCVSFEGVFFVGLGSTEGIFLIFFFDLVDSPGSVVVLVFSE